MQAGGDRSVGTGQDAGNVRASRLLMERLLSGERREIKYDSPLLLIPVDGPVQRALRFLACD